ncbi:endonuclease/exonuclease/phosphatase family protein [Akkermansiaceae bacterium]|nr:endonuclease/exonuclease/phosphatase family protein [Akkermansiaceae bacterium]
MPKVFLLLFLALIPASSTCAADHLRLLSYNVWYGFTKVPERKKNFLKWMETQNPDIVSLQELNGYTADKLKADAAAWRHPHSAILKENGFPTGITSRFPIEEVRRFREGFHHGLLRARIKGTYYYVIHLHPSNWEIRGREADLILADIAELPKGALVALVGDFNTFSTTDERHYVKTRLEPFFAARDTKYKEKNLRDGKLDYSVIRKFTAAGLIDLEHSKRGAGYRFTGSFPTKIKKPGDHGEARRLDYVFASPSLAKRVTRAEIIADDTTWILSDHLPVIVELTHQRRPKDEK